MVFESRLAIGGSPATVFDGKGSLRIPPWFVLCSATAVSPAPRLSYRLYGEHHSPSFDTVTTSPKVLFFLFSFISQLFIHSALTTRLEGYSI